MHFYICCNFEDTNNSNAILGNPLRVAAGSELPGRRNPGPLDRTVVKNLLHLDEGVPYALWSEVQAGLSALGCGFHIAHDPAVQTAHVQVMPGVIDVCFEGAA